MVDGCVIILKEVNNWIELSLKSMLTQTITQFGDHIINEKDMNLEKFNCKLTRPIKIE